MRTLKITQTLNWKKLAFIAIRNDLISQDYKNPNIQEFFVAENDPSFFTYPTSINLIKNLSFAHSFFIQKSPLLRENALQYLNLRCNCTIFMVLCNNQIM